MVKASDLRSGNLHEGKDFSIPRLGWSSVKIDDKVYEAITAFGIRLVEQGLLKFVPLRLSPEWMKALGFTRTNSLETFYQKDGFPTVIFSEGKYWVRGVKKPMEYVHELQNVHYCLSGEELTVK